MMRHLLLGLMRHSGPQHGYALMKSYHDGSGHRVSIGNVYRELQRLASEGLVRSAPNPPDADPRRIVYEITEPGAEHFDAWLARSTRDGADGEHLLKAFFAINAQPSVAGRILEYWEDELATQRRTLERARCDAVERNGRGGMKSLPLWLDHRLRHLAVDLEFVGLVRSVCNGGTSAERERKPASTERPRSTHGSQRARTRRS